MNATSQIRITKATSLQRPAIIRLLHGANLPVDDLPTSLDNFFVATDNDRIIGAVGLELYGDCGLLRSLVVDKEYRNKSVASDLVRHLENSAKAKGINCMYLLTETAPAYFERKGYQKVTRDDVPDGVKVSSEFSYVCPASAIVMKKQLS